MMGWYGYSGMWSMGLFATLGVVFCFAVVGVIIWAIVRRRPNDTTMRVTAPVGPRDAYPVQGGSALDVLDQRYARGEIDTATFEQMRARLAPPERSRRPLIDEEAGR